LCGRLTVRRPRAGAQGRHAGWPVPAAAAARHSRPLLVPRPCGRVPVPDTRHRPRDGVRCPTVWRRLALAADAGCRSCDLDDLRGRAVAPRRRRVGWPTGGVPGVGGVRRHGGNGGRELAPADASRGAPRAVNRALVLVGVNHERAPLDVRERLAIPGVRLPAALAQLLTATGPSEAMLLATCNRVEVWGVEREAGASTAVARWLGAH